MSVIIYLILILFIGSKLFELYNDSLRDTIKPSYRNQFIANTYFRNAGPIATIDESYTEVCAE